MKTIKNVQLPTKNMKFIETLSKAAINNQTHITYWCKPTNISLNGKANISLIGTKIDITDIETQRVIVSGEIEDVIIDKTEELYNNKKLGGNNNLGMPAAYKLDDWLWEVNDTLGGKYTKSDDIGAVCIRLRYLPINKKEVVRGNQAGRKY